MNKLKIATGTIAVFVFGLAFFLMFPSQIQYYFSAPNFSESAFKIKSVDTMKYSRDLAKAKLNDPSFNSVIEKQMAQVVDLGATHVAIATPYDEEFIPFLTKWVQSARRHNLSVFFRGNFSGWEEWFHYPRIDRDTHKILLRDFISSHPELFEDGDIFSPCHECENGGPGDPRWTGDKKGYNNFLIDEYRISKEAFGLQGKSIEVYSSMNGDIAREIIDKPTAKALGGTILVDHYVKTPEKFANDIMAISRRLDANVGVGEFGAPIPDINGGMNESQQAEYVSQMFDFLYSKSSGVTILNYWVLTGGSTSLTSETGYPKKVYNVVKTYFNLPKVTGRVSDPFGKSLEEVKISVTGTEHSALSANGGTYSIFLAPKYRNIVIEKEGYKTVSVDLPKEINVAFYKDVILEPIEVSRWYKIQLFLKSLKKRIYADQAN